MSTCVMSLLLFVFIASFQVAHSRVLTQEDYTLYFDEYHFDWSNAEDWNVITPDDTPNNEIIACTLPIEAIKKSLCVHTKSEGGFTVTFRDSPNPHNNAAHTGVDNDFDAFLRSQSIYNDDSDMSDIELDFLNDDDWNEISAIWNWNAQQNQHQLDQNRMYHQYTQSLQTNVRRRLTEEEEMEFLFGKKNRHRHRRVRRYRRQHHQHHPMSPMMHMMMQMMQMQMMMKMMKSMMPGMAGGAHGGCTGIPCAKVQDGDDLYNYDDLYDGYQEEDQTDHALYSDFGDFYSGFQQQDYDYDDDDLNAFRRVRRLTGRGGRRGGFQNMMTKVPDMMMQMAMMKSMGEIMRTMNPYIAMMMLHGLRGGGGMQGGTHGAHCAQSCRPGGACNCRPMGMGGMNHLPMGMGGMGMMMPHQFMMNPAMMHLGMPGMMNPMMMGGMMNPMMGMGGMGGMQHGGGKHNKHGGDMNGNAVKKCHPLQNGLEVCVTFDKAKNHLTVDVKCKNCKKVKGKSKKKGKGKGKGPGQSKIAKSNRPFPEKLSKMVKTLVKQRVFGNAAHQGEGKAPPKGAPQAVGAKSMGSTGVGMQGMKAMEKAAARVEEGSTYYAYQDMWRRMLMERETDNNWVQFDTMEGNIGYAMWRAEFMDWHRFRDYDENSALSDTDEWMEYGEYRNFGNFVHYYDTFESNWNEEDNWSDVDGVNRKSWIQFGDEAIPMDMGQKCGHKLPFLNFKLCSKVSEDDISVFFKRSSADAQDETDINAAAAQMEGDNQWYSDYSSYMEDLGTEYEWNDVRTLQQIIENEFEQSLFRFSNDEDWHEIINTFPASHAQERRHLLFNQEATGGAVPGQRLGEHDHKETEIELFGHLYRLKGISKCGGDSENPRFCVGVHLGEPMRLPHAVQLPMTKMCNFMYIAKTCLGFDPNRMELKLSIQFQSIHKWKDIAKRLLDVIKHLPHKVQRYMKWAEKSSATSAAAKVMNEGDDMNMDIEEDVMDEWYDEREDEEWVITSAKVNGDNMYWDDDEIWETQFAGDNEEEVVNDEGMKVREIETITTNKGHQVARKCLHLMGKRLCLCQFLSWIDSSQYHCHPQQGFSMGALMGVSSAKETDLNVYDYIDVYYDADEDMNQ